MGASCWNETEDKLGTDRKPFDGAGTATGRAPQSVQPQQTVTVVGSPQVAQPAVAQPAAVAKATPPPQQNQVHSISEPEKKFRAARKVQETILGVDLANNILEILAAKLDVGEIKGEKFGLATTKLDAAVALLTKVREVAERTHPSV